MQNLKKLIELVAYKKQGEQDKLEKVQEYKVEMLCVAERLTSAIKAMKEAHPYEEVAYCVVEMVRGLIR